MKKIAIATDTNAGLEPELADELGIRIVPMPFVINGETYYENISLSGDEFYKYLERDADISTSQPSPDSVIGVWEDILEKYDELVYIPMSSGLSGSCQTARLLSEDYDDRVQVVNNQRISVTQRQSVLDAHDMAKAGMDAAAIRLKLEETKFDSSIYIMLNTLKYLKKGGRITPAAALIGDALRIKPVLQIQGEKLDAYTIAKTTKKAMQKMMAAIDSDIAERLGGDKSLINFMVAYTYDRPQAEEFADIIRDKYSCGYVQISPLSLSVSCHIGPGSLAIACTKKMDASQR